MPINILMPALSPTMEKGNLAKWLKKEGDSVKPGDVIAEIETDKATMEVEAVDEGTVAKILVPEGTADVPVNQLIAVLAGEGEDVRAAAATAASAPQARTPLQQAGEAGAAPASPPPDAAMKSTEATPSAPAGAPAMPPLSPSQGRPSAPSPAAPRGDGGGRLFASPLARRLAKEAGIEIERILGTGPHGRIVARDIEAARTGAPGMRPPPSAAAPAPVAVSLPPSDQQIAGLFEPGTYELVPHDNIRKIIARRLVQAKQTIPHFYLSIDCVIDRLLAAREEINTAAAKDKDGKPAYKLSVNDFVIKALALALQKIPEANVTWTESGMLKHKHSDIGVAVAIPGGLITPVVRRAEQKSLSVISKEMKDFATRARARKLLPHEYQGGSSAVSNLGMYGVKDFAAVINQPHATILAVGAGEQRPIVHDGQVAIATIMSCTLSTDHRAVDGALGAELFAAFRRFIENPVEMLV